MSLRKKVLFPIIFVLILLLPTQLAYHFWPSYSFIQGIKIDYLAITVSPFDLVWVLLLAVSFQKSWIKVFRHWYHQKSFWVVILLVAINITMAKVPLVAFIKFLRITQGLVFYWILGAIGKRKQTVGLVTRGLLVGMLLANVLATGQFVANHSLGGVWYFLGERTFGVSTPGISTFVFGGVERLRAYSFFSHPNSLAGYLVACLLVLPLFAKNQLAQVIYAASLVVVLLTNSLTAIVSGVVVLLLRLTSIKLSTRQVFGIVVVVNILLLLGSWFLAPEVLTSAQRGLTGRFYLNKQVLTNLFSVGWLGLGLGNEVFATATANYYWTPQPVHNLLLLAFSNIGILVIPLLVWLYFQTGKKTQSQALLGLLTFVGLTGSLDHYWWSLPQNFFLLFVLVYIIKGYERPTPNH